MLKMFSVLIAIVLASATLSAYAVAAPAEHQSRTAGENAQPRMRHPVNTGAPAPIEPAPIITKDERDVLVMKTYAYTVQRGDTLYKLSLRFNISIDSLRSPGMNPRLAKRKNPNLLYRGEVISVPLYTLAKKPESALAPSDLIVMTQNERLKAEARSTAAEEKTIAVQKRIEAWYRPALGIMMVLLLLALSAVAFVWLALRAARKHVSPAPVPVPEPVRLTRAEDILLALRETTGAELERLVDMPLTPDEVGNPVTIKKVKDFLAKREYLRACPATEWPGIMAGSTRNQEVTPQGAERPA